MNVVLLLVVVMTSIASAQSSSRNLQNTKHDVETLEASLTCR